MSGERVGWEEYDGLRWDWCMWGGVGVVWWGLDWGGGMGKVA